MTGQDGHLRAVRISGERKEDNIIIISSDIVRNRSDGTISSVRPYLLEIDKVGNPHLIQLREGYKVRKNCGNFHISGFRFPLMWKNTTCLFLKLLA